MLLVTVFLFVQIWRLWGDPFPMEKKTIYFSHMGPKNSQLKVSKERKTKLNISSATEQTFNGGMTRLQERCTPRTNVLIWIQEGRKKVIWPLKLYALNKQLHT